MHRNQVAITHRCQGGDGEVDAVGGVPAFEMASNGRGTGNKQAPCPVSVRAKEP